MLFSAPIPLAHSSDSATDVTTLREVFTFDRKVNRFLQITLSHKRNSDVAGRFGLQITKIEDLFRQRIDMVALTVNALHDAVAKHGQPIQRTMLCDGMCKTSAYLKTNGTEFLHGEKACDRFFFLTPKVAEYLANQLSFDGASIYVISSSRNEKPTLNSVEYLPGFGMEDSFCPPVIHMSDYVAFCVSLLPATTAQS